MPNADSELLDLVLAIQHLGNGYGVLSNASPESGKDVADKLKQIDISGLSAKDIAILVLVALILWRMVHGDTSAAQQVATGNDLQVGGVLIALAALLRKERH